MTEGPESQDLARAMRHVDDRIAPVYADRRSMVPGELREVAVRSFELTRPGPRVT